MLFLNVIMGLSCFLSATVPQKDLNKIQLPPGFKIRVWVDNVPGARSMAWGQNGTLFVGTRDEGKVYAVTKDKKVKVIAKGLEEPNGVAFKDGDLYVAEISRILKFEQIESKLDYPPKPKLITDRYPTEGHHGWKFIAFGPDNKLYVPVGAPCNICEKPDPYASITRMDPDGKNFEVFVRGVRNTVGFDWHPITKEMWFSDNGRDMLGNDIPSDELNRAAKAGLHFGYPYCHAGTISDPEYGKKKQCKDYSPPAQKLGPHVAALGVQFYTGTAFPEEYRNQIFIAEHGSWNRTEPIGYRVTLVKLGANGSPTAYTPFAQGWLEKSKYWGRPVDLELTPEGHLLVSDDHAGVIYEISPTR